MEIYSEIVKALQSEESVMLATIISTTGSTPACAHSAMLVKGGGMVSVGTVGGGCVEGEVLLSSNRLYGSGTAGIETFHLNEDNVEHGLICGGSLDILIEPVTRKSLPLYEALASQIRDGKDAVLATLLTSGGNISEKFLTDPSAAAPSPGAGPSDRSLAGSTASSPGALPADLSGQVLGALRRQVTRRIPVAGGELILQPVFGTPPLIIFGGGHVGKFVCRAASMAGFHVTVVDDREQYASPQRFPDAAATVVGEFPEVVDQLPVTQATYLVIVTRGHQFDERVLERIIHSPARYIGMIGSRRKILTAYEHLVERGIPRELFERVHAPVGLEIGALTAEEIGISVAAEIIHYRRTGGTKSITPKSYEMKPLLELFDKQHEPH